MMSSTPIHEYSHINPKGTINVDVVGAYCTSTITDGYTTAHYIRLPTPLWEGTLNTFISSIILASNLDMTVTIGALALVRHYQSILIANNACVAHDADEAVRLFLTAYMVAARLTSACAPVRMARWEEITCGEYTVDELSRMEQSFYETFDFAVRISPRAHSTIFEQVLTSHEISMRLIAEQTARELLREEEEDLWDVETTLVPVVSASFARHSHRTHHGNGTGVRSLSSGSSSIIIIMEPSGRKEPRNFSLDEEEEVLFSKAETAQYEEDQRQYESFVHASLRSPSIHHHQNHTTTFV